MLAFGSGSRVGDRATTWVGENKKQNRAFLLPSLSLSLSLYHGLQYVCSVLQHPGGADIILEYAGGEASAAFWDKGHSPDAHRMLDDYYIGELKQVRLQGKAWCNYA